MESLVFISPLVNMFLSFFQGIFAGSIRPARTSLSLLVLGIVVTGSLSVRGCFNRVMSKLSPKKLKSFYYLLSKGKVCLDLWSRHAIRPALSAVPENLASMPILLSVDDTLVEKEGTHFAHRKRLSDHSGYRLARKGATKPDDKGRFIDGHCFVTMLMLVPTLNSKGGVTSRSTVVAQRMWTGEVSRLDMAKQLVQLALSELGERQVFLLCDSWYPRGEVAQLAEIPNLTMICNARHDSAMFELPQRPERPQRGRPRVFGERVRTTDFELAPVAGTEWRVGVAGRNLHGPNSTVQGSGRHRHCHPKGECGRPQALLLHKARSVRRVRGASRSVHHGRRAKLCRRRGSRPSGRCTPCDGQQKPPASS